TPTEFHDMICIAPFHPHTPLMISRAVGCWHLTPGHGAIPGASCATLFISPKV
ncbi:hypothetical protein BDZ97DRAFT_1805481, partial [Flammula alnicola]